MTNMDFTESQNSLSKSVSIDSISDGFSVIPELKWMILFKNSLKKHNHSYSSVIDYTHLLSNLLPTSNFKNSNQYKIVTANSIQSLIIPLVKGGKDENWDIKRISYDHNWIKEHKNALQTAYGKSPFFEYYDYKLFSAFDSRPEYLCELNQKIMNMILPYLGLNHSHFTHSSSFSNDHNYLEPTVIRSNLEISATLNNFEDPTIHAFPTLPTTMNVPEYTQVFDVKFGFQPDVSILDLLFNLGPLSTEYIKNL
jgi:hypothetical protein